MSKKKFIALSSSFPPLLRLAAKAGVGCLLEGFSVVGVRYLNQGLGSFLEEGREGGGREGGGREEERHRDSEREMSGHLMLAKE